MIGLPPLPNQSVSPPRSLGDNARSSRTGYDALTSRILHSCARGLLNLPANALVFLIRVYQGLFSPLLPIIFGPACGCRFAPSCSHYAIEAIRTHGALAGVFLATIRILKCMPLHPGGFDPVPPRRPLKPRCTRVAV